MASITYNPPQGEADSVTWNGTTFQKGKAVQVKDNAMLRKAQNNPHFKVSGGAQEAQQAEALGNYRDPLTGQEITLVRKAPDASYLGGPPAAEEIAGPSPATQGSTAVNAAQTNTVAETFGVESEAELHSGEHPAAPEYKGPEGTVAKRAPGRPRKAD